MPQYVYKAITKEGVVVRNRVDSPSRQSLIKKLKERKLVTNRHNTGRICKK